MIDAASNRPAPNPFPAWCEVRILSVAIPSEALRTVVVHYVVATEGGEPVMGAADVDVEDLGDDYSVTIDRITQGPALPESLHSEIEEAAVRGYDVHRQGGEAYLDQHNASLASAYVYWRQAAHGGCR